MNSEYRRLPSVDSILSDKRIQRLGEIYPHDTLVALVRQQIEEARTSIARGTPSPSFHEMVGAICTHADTLTNPSLRRVINAAGVIINTNLGRAPLSQEAIDAMRAVAQGYSNLEFDLDSGERGSRHVHIEEMLCQLTGAEAAFAVNNNAAAVLLALSALAKDCQVIVSRGQAVEIGGGFRIPDVMRQSGAELVEVGTTNCTYIHDYEDAITDKTAAFLRVHSSNFRVVGFTHSASLLEMVELASKFGLPVLDDLGSGCLLDTAQFGLAPEPTVQESVKAGASLTFFSGDKLLGGPQAGIIMGKKELVDRLKRHPLARAARIDKLCIAALAATLIHYLKNEALSKIPVWHMISMPLEAIEERALVWTAIVDTAKVIDGLSMVGGGSLPGEGLPTKLVAINADSGWHGNVQELARRLRQGEPAIVARIEKDMLLLDPRTVLPEEDEALLQALQRALRA